MELIIDELKLTKQASDIFVEEVVGKIEPSLKILAKELKQKEWFSLAEACDYIGISRGSLTNFIEKGLPVSVVGQVKRVKKSHIDDFLDSYSR